MADTATTIGSDGPEDETPTQRQARLRREKRQAKLASTGEDRLAKIKQLNGGIAPPDEVLGGPAAPKLQAATVDDDPDEVDISSHAYTSKTASGNGTPRGGAGAAGGDNPLAQAMMQMQAQQARQQQQGGGPQDEDPMAQMMQQMMGMMGGGDPNNPNAPPPDMTQLPQMLSAMMGAGGMGGPGGQQPATSSAYLWRIVHALSAFTIAVYIALTSTFNGTKLARSQSVYTEEVGYGLGPRLFWMFATAELVLQSTRFFVERGQLQGNGWLAMIANSGFVPEPYAQYVRMIGRYSTIYTTIVSDAMVIIFALGVMAWWKGMAAS